MAIGANILTLTMTDAAGNVASTNISVIGDPMNLTIDDQPGNSWIGLMATVTGTIDSSDYTVWVNGVEVTNYTDNGLGGWNWSVDDVPVPNGGTAVIHASAVPNPGGGPRVTVPDSATKNVEMNKESPAYWFTSTFENQWAQDTIFYARARLGGWSHAIWTETNHWTNGYVATNAIINGRDFNGYCFWVYDYSGAESYDDCQTNVAVWPVESPANGGAPVRMAAARFGTCQSSVTTTGNVSPARIPLQKWNEHQDFTNVDGAAVTVWHTDRTQKAVVTLRTGGKRLFNLRNLFYITGSATEYTTSSDDSNWQQATVPPGSIQVLGQSLEPVNSTAGCLYTVLPDNSEWDITPQVPVQRCMFSNNAVKCLLVNQCAAIIPTNRSRFELGVGERVNLSLITNPRASRQLDDHGGKLVHE